MRARWVVLLALCSTPLFACVSVTDLTAEGEDVIASKDPPAGDCERIDEVYGYSGGAWGGDYITHDNLLEYAMNDLRNETAAMGGNYVEYDPPLFGEEDGNTTTATVHGVAFDCP
jgi:uncharacterized protein DUF4156